ncbi:ADP-ribosylglycohydrolase family protein [Vibrio comitans]|uniref:ADP-ribosylglycohydrolase n=1 Tax=Vibrio comitans NBRC 102076 TaxID=1219078 RepID=A0A4Y3IN79_9VIBR|nr:ADP-ribosylglycohydrolase family protein [Vibrio comitans]GEA60959.1 hypothetical protein VCO01S_21520 [Vibrio comitans NBRC 102076]
MANQTSHRVKSMLLGSLVADAAAVGFHWLYDQKRIRDISKGTPEFHPPNKDDYANDSGFFAHEERNVGDCSQYGEQALVLMRSIAQNGNRYHKSHYESSFQEHFGYGGKYIGYIDHPTRDTLDNITKAEHEAILLAKAIPFDGDENTQRMMLTKVLANVKQVKGAKCAEKIEAAVRQTHDDDHMVAYALNIATKVEAISGYHGANDEQLTAISKLPSLVAAYCGDPELSKVVESAVRVTNDNQVAVQFGQAVATIIEAALEGASPHSAITIGRDSAPHLVKALIDEALSYEHESNLTVTSRFGMSCNLTYGVPSVIHNLATSTTYQEAIQRNIYAGGDSCGRSILLGAVLGACYGIGGAVGIPLQWIEKLTQKHDIDELLQSLGYS